MANAIDSAKFHRSLSFPIRSIAFFLFPGFTFDREKENSKLFRRVDGNDAIRMRDTVRDPFLRAQRNERRKEGGMSARNSHLLLVAAPTGS